MVAKKFCQQTTLTSKLLSFIESHKAGSPTDATVYWVSKKPKELAKAFNELYNEQISNRTVKLALRDLGYRYRKQQKQLATGLYGQRDLQFKIIFNLVSVMSLQSPIISIDCKKKERLGNLYREGKVYSQKALKVYDHDYQHLSKGKVVPYGIYDLQANKGYISIGNSGETADFIIDNLRWWWTEYGCHSYINAQNILILCDAGGANSYKHHVFKDRLLKLAKELNISLIICHYPPYSSKWNPIEHKLFCHVHRAMSGYIFTDYQMIKERIEATSTLQGLTVIVRLNLKEYQTGMKAEKLQTNRIQYNLQIPLLSYRIFP